VLQARFKRCFLDGMRELYRQRKLNLPEGMSFQNFAEFDAFLNHLERKHWQIDRSDPLDAVRAALSYIARYLGKPPMSENRLLWHNRNKVCFTYKDYLNKAIERKFICSTAEFFFRVTEHVPLPNFPMVRFYGLFSTRNKKKLMEKAAKFIPPPYGVELLRCEPPKTCRDHRLATTGVDISKCPECGRELEEVKVYYPGQLTETFAELLQRLENSVFVPANTA
ncbi:MAG: transposase, partial [Sphingobacteriales bacterium]|nr:transposase [Sphingobacteriales bacterium]